MKLYSKEINTHVNIKGFLMTKNTFYYENDDFIYLGSGDLVETNQLSILENQLDLKVNNDHNDMPFIGGFFGIFNYDLVKTYEKIPQMNKALLGYKNILALYVTTFYVVDKETDKRSIYSLGQETFKGKKEAFSNIEHLLKVLTQPYFPNVVSAIKEYSVRSNTTKQEFIDKVTKAKKYIRDGDIFQVVLSQRFEVVCKSRATDLLDAIDHEESTFKYYFNVKGIQVIGLSPEILVKRQEKNVITNPIAGTRKRGISTEEEIMLEEDLLNDTKEKAEHSMLVDLARNDMGKIAEIGSVDVSNYMTIKRYKRVIHLTSKVLGKTQESNAKILKTFLPAGTLTGAPKIRAMEIIETLEEDKREIYGGCIGFLSFNENMETAITIRTMIIKDNMAYIQAGAGIVYDSVPEREYEETIEKASQLIELIKEGIQ